jgi:hypothetical protein
VRIVQIKKPQNFHEILENELEFLEHCVDNPFGELLLNVQLLFQKKKKSQILLSEKNFSTWNNCRWILTDPMNY